jgi:hypothetical protein
MSEDEQGQTQGKLVTQLASDATYLARGKHNMKILSIIEKRLVLPLTYLNISSVDDEGDKLLTESLLEFYVSVGGRGRRDVIQGEGVMKGAQPNTEAEIDRPNFLSRHNPFDREAQDKERLWKERHGLE